LLDNGWLEDTISSGRFWILKSVKIVPIPANGYSSIPVSICEPYRKWKGLSRGRKSPTLLGKWEKIKTPILIDWGFFERAFL
jgi:hypothetical protein